MCKGPLHYFNSCFSLLWWRKIKLFLKGSYAITYYNYFLFIQEIERKLIIEQDYNFFYKISRFKDIEIKTFGINLVSICTLSPHYAIYVFRMESAFHVEFNSIWVDRTKSNSTRQKCSSHVILFPQISFTIQK